MITFNCKRVGGNGSLPDLSFDWDRDAGTVSGRDADLIRKMAKPGDMVDAHPMPWAYKLGRTPLKSFRDMAAIVGSWWRLPPELAPHYPKAPDEDPNVYDLDGNVIGEVTQ